MKMMRKNWKDRKGVSPVIATILMVAITVVLAAVLYVMVMGFGGDGAGQAPTMKLTNDGSKLVVSIDKAVDIDTDAIMIKIGDDGTLHKLSLVASETGATGASPLDITVKLVDLGGDRKLSNGDYFTYEDDRTEAGDKVTITILWTNGDTNQVIASFDVPATDGDETDGDETPGDDTT